MWMYLLSLNVIALAQDVDFSRPSFIEFRSVKSGDCVTLNCPLGYMKRPKSVVWYKQVFGEMPERVGENIVYRLLKIPPRFNASFTMETSENGISLIIQRINKKLGGLYYCETISSYDATVSNGTLLAVTDDDEDDVKVSVIQSGVWDSVPAGGSRATLQCSVLSESATAELRVLWFRSAPSQSHPQIIYTHHNNNNNNNNTDQCRSSTRTCVYNISVNDTGTYYCAVVLCGRIVFGNGIPVQLGNVSQFGPEVYLTLVAVVCVIVIFAQTLIICKMRKCQLSREYVKTPEQDGELNYVALRVHRARPESERRKREKTTSECVYSDVSRVT